MVKYCVLIVSLLYSSVVYAGEIRSEEDLWFLWDTNIRYLRGGNIRLSNVRTRDIALAFSNIFNVKMYFYDRRTFLPERESYIELVEDSGIQIISYHEYKDGRRILNRSFYCYVEDYRRATAMCFDQKYYVNGREFKFDESLKGKDVVYDWIVQKVFEREKLNED